MNELFLSPPNAQPRYGLTDGKRIQSQYGDECDRCHRNSDCIGPFTVLQGRAFCSECYPKMVAVLEADAKLAVLKESL